MVYSYLALEQDHWTDKPSSAPGRLATVDEVLQLAHLHSALKPKAQARGRSGWLLTGHFVYVCVFTKTPCEVCKCVCEYILDIR